MSKQAAHSTRNRRPWTDAERAIPGRKTTDPALITLDALELVTRAELMARNTVQNLPKPLAQLVQLRGALKRQITRRARATEEQTT